MAAGRSALRFVGLLALASAGTVSMVPASAAAEPAMATIRVEAAGQAGRNAASMVRDGTSFRVSQSELVTAAHTVAGCISAEVAGSGPVLGVRRAQSGADVAVVEVAASPGPALRMGTVEPGSGAAGVHVGYTQAGLSILHTRSIGPAWMVSGNGQVSRVQVFAIAPGGRARQGMSGAPVMVDDVVVGVHVAEQPRHGRVLVAPISGAKPLLSGDPAERKVLHGVPAGPGAVRRIRCTADGGHD